jgi:maleylacetate reductase
VSVHDPHPARVVFGEGARARLQEELERLGIRRALVLASARLAGSIAYDLGPRAAGVRAGARMHVPRDSAAEARAAAQDLGADGLVAAGGGSTVGLAKAVALELALPIVALPTSFAGSEMTSIWGITEDGKKRTGRDDRVRPRTVIYDPDLIATLSPSVAGPSGMNAIAHAVEALYARGLDPMTAALAEESLRSLARALSALAEDRSAAPARSEALFGAWLAGVCLDRAAMGVHHRLCHTLGGSFGLPHAETHAVLIAHAAAFNSAAAPEAMARVARALGAQRDGGADAPSALFDLGARLGCPTSLRALGLAEADLDRAADFAVERPYDNPRPVDRAWIRQLLDDAWAGRRPRPAEALGA